ncbi:MAG: O-antigen ligase family protein [Lachnospiraceae bacterium]
MGKEIKQSSLQGILTKILLIAIAYIVMIITNNSYSGFVFIAIYLIGSILLSPEELFEIYIICMFMNYPIVNAVSIWIIILLFLVRPHKKIHIYLRSTLGFSVIFLLAVVLTTLTAENMLLAVNEIYTWIYVIGIIVCCNMCSKIERIITSIKTAGIVLAIIYVADFLGASITGVINEWNFFRIPDYNYSALVMFCSLAILRYIRTRITPVSIVEEIILLAGVVATNSRGVLVFVIVYYVVMFFQSIKRINLSKMIIFSLVLCMGVFIVTRSEFFQYGIQQLSTITKSDHYSNYIRWELYGKIIKDMVPKHWLFGVGPNNFKTEYIKYFQISFSANHAHNVYLQILTEEGVIGLVVLVFYMICLAKSLVKSLSIKANIKFMNMILFIVMTYAAYGMLEYVLGDSRSLSLLLMIITLYEIELRKFRNGKESALDNLEVIKNA